MLLSRRLHRERQRAVAAAEPRGAAAVRRHAPHRSERATSSTSAIRKTLARAWVIPGTPGLEHRIGGIEKDALTGNISYAPENHEKQTQIRAEKVARIAQDIGELDLAGPESGDVLVIGWGGTYGSLRQAQQALAAQGKKVSHAHLRWLSPLEPGLAKIIHNFKHVIVAELNMGQLRTILRASS